MPSDLNSKRNPLTEGTSGQMDDVPIILAMEMLRPRVTGRGRRGAYFFYTFMKENRWRKGKTHNKNGVR